MVQYKIILNNGKEYLINTDVEDYNSFVAYMFRQGGNALTECKIVDVIKHGFNTVYIYGNAISAIEFNK